MKKQIIISIIFLALSSSLFAQNKNAKILFFQGESYILEYHKGYQKIPAQINKRINPRDIIVTGKNGKVKIRLPDDSQIVIKENSKVTFSLVSSKMQRIKIKQGGVLSNVNKLLSNKGYTVETPRGVAGVRGTEFIVEYEKHTDKSSVEVNSGKVFVTQNKMEKKPFAVVANGNIAYGKELRVKRKTATLTKEEGVSFNNKEFELTTRKKDIKRSDLYKHIDGWELN